MKQIAHFETTIGLLVCFSMDGSRTLQRAESRFARMSYAYCS